MNAQDEQDEQEVQLGEREKERDEAAVAEAKSVVIDCRIRVGGVEFVLVPAIESRARAVRDEASPASSGALASRLYQARRRAGLTQARLATLLGKSQAMISQAESGRARVGDRYVRAVLDACGLEATWGLPEQDQARREEATGWDLDPKDIAGLDPETLVPVRKGSARDVELREKLVWWTGVWTL